MVTIAMKTFSEKVKEVVAKIPRGKVLTYKEVAKKAGNEKKGNHQQDDDLRLAN